MPLIVLFKNLTEDLDKGDCVIGIILDFQKAFGAVNHSILFYKLFDYGVRGTVHK